MTTPPTGSPGHRQPDHDRLQETRIAAAGLSRCVEPEDASAASVVEALGVIRTWELLSGSSPSAEEREACARVHELKGARRPQAVLPQLAERAGARARSAEPHRDLRNAARLGGGFLVPDDPAWPESLNDLGETAPHGLWWRGRLEPSWRERPWLGVVGTRDPTGYGTGVAEGMAHQVVLAGGVVVSGGALGIDAAAHAAALDRGDQRELVTVAVMAGGIDKLYPAANASLLNHIATHQLVLSEHPPGCAPTRWRFLHRNRLIAALASGVLVVEGRWRSGSLSTAHRAAELGRWVGAVPGPVTSEFSEGPHRLIREGAAELVSTPMDALEAVGLASSGVPSQGTLPGLESERLSSADAGADAAVGAEKPATALNSHAGVAMGTARQGGGEAQRRYDSLDPAEQRILESLPLRGGVGLDRILSAAGLGPSEGLPALHRLQAKGAVLATPSGFRRAPRD